MEIDERRFKRAYHRSITGLKMPGSYIFVTLTTWPGMQITLHTAWRRFCARMRRRNCLPAYYAVSEWNEKGSCQHLHVVMRLRYAHWELMRQQWSKSCEYEGLLRIQIIATYGSAGNVANYLSKYLTKSFESANNTDNAKEGRGFWYSHSWIFRKWRVLSKLYWRFGLFIDYEYWYWLPHDTRIIGMSLAVLQLVRRLQRPPWSITLAKELRSIGLVTTRLDWNYGLRTG